ncbi:hypothetical protein FGB62_30g121 [Gracilaria domingensis]|nr:hypothetical protein FGB62_30g121 [Gracilaria domingensis]
MGSSCTLIAGAQSLPPSIGSLSPTTTVTSIRVLENCGGGAILAGRGVPNAMLEKNGAGRDGQRALAAGEAARGLDAAGTKALRLFIGLGAGSSCRRRLGGLRAQLEKDVGAGARHGASCRDRSGAAQMSDVMWGVSPRSQSGRLKSHSQHDKWSMKARSKIAHVFEDNRRFGPSVCANAWQMAIGWQVIGAQCAYAADWMA